MSDKEKQELQKLIPSIEQNVEKLESLEQNNENAKEQIQELKQKLEYLKDIAWDRQSEIEREQMLKVLNGEQESTEVESNAGSILVDSELTEKMRKKHLNNPNLRGMVTSDEFLSFPKVAKNVEPKKEARGYTWQVKADDENILTYGSRKYELDNEEVHRLATNHSKTEPNERVAEEDRRGHPYHPVFNDLNFRKSANEDIIAQNKPNSANSFNKEQNTNKNTQKEFSAEQIKAMQEKVKKTSQNLGLGDSTKGKGVELGKNKGIDLGKGR